MPAGSLLTSREENRAGFLSVEEDTQLGEGGKEQLTNVGALTSLLQLRG